MADAREIALRKYRAKMIEHKTMEAQVKKGTTPCAAWAHQWRNAENTTLLGV